MPASAPELRQITGRVSRPRCARFRLRHAPHVTPPAPGLTRGAPRLSPRSHWPSFWSTSCAIYGAMQIYWGRGGVTEQDGSDARTTDCVREAVYLRSCADWPRSWLLYPSHTCRLMVQCRAELRVLEYQWDTHRTGV